jgi:cholesterol transport system auxiliary component
MMSSVFRRNTGASQGNRQHGSRRAIESIAATARIHWAGGAFGLKTSVLAGVLLLGACSALPTKPVRATQYDFGPGALTVQPATRQALLAPVALEEITTVGGALENLPVLYRLGYADVQELRPYAQARWSMPPAQLVRQRLRDKLSLQRPVFTAREGLASGGAIPAQLQLRMELEEFSHYFSAATESTGLVRLRVTLIDVTAAGEKLVGQRTIVAQRPAPTPDAPGGVRALTAATDAAIDELDQWLRQQPARP